MACRRSAVRSRLAPPTPEVQRYPLIPTERTKTPRTISDAPGFWRRDRTLVDRRHDLTAARLHEVNVVVRIEVLVLRYAGAPVRRNRAQSYVGRKRRPNGNPLLHGHWRNLLRCYVLLNFCPLFRRDLHRRGLSECTRGEERCGRKDHKAFHSVPPGAGVHARQRMTGADVQQM